MGDLDGKRVLLFGASSGIGLAAAERFAERGARLALVARGNGVHEAVGRAQIAGAEAHALRADMTDRDALADSVERAVELLGGLDVVVLNAAAGAYGPFDEIPREDFERVMDVTFHAAVDAVRLVLPELEHSHGTLVVTGSIAGRLPLPLMSPYVAAKHALRGFVGSLRMDLAARGSNVRVAVVDPGPVDSPFWKHATTPPGRKPPEVVGSYSADTVARTLVDMAESPRREVTVGGAMVLAEGAYRLVGGLAEAVMAFGARALLTRDPQPNDPTGGIHEPSGDGEEGGGLGGRPSLMAAARRAPGRLLRR